MSLVAPELLALQRLYHWETTTPNRVALTQPMDGGQVREFTWREVADGARRMAAFLQDQGWEPGSRVAILSKNCAWWMMSDLAIWMAGYVSVPLYPTLAPETVHQILTHSECRACFVGKLDTWDTMRPGVPTDLLCIAYPVSPADAQAQFPGWDALCAQQAPMPGQPVRDADELCTLIYTSGTTGLPKGVMHSFGNFAWGIDKGLARVPITGEDRLLSYLPLAHVVERMLVEHAWLRTSSHVYFAETLDTFAQDMQRARPTVFFSVPRLWVKFQQGVHQKLPEQRLRLLLRLPIVGALVRRKILAALGLDHCRFAAGGAAPMPQALLAWYERLGLHIQEGYGMTENLAISHMTLIGEDQRGTVGPTYPGVEQRINPDDGEVQVRSPAVMLGYFKDPLRSQEAFTEDGWLRTGDKGTIDARGCLRITGRVKDLFKTGKGKYVAPAPIEDKLAMHPAVEACCVAGAGLGQPLGIVMLAADAVAQAQDPATRQALAQSLNAHRQAINEHLDPHEQLQALVLVSTPWTVDNDMITPTLKVKRNRIDEVYGPRFEAWESGRQPIVWADH